MSDTFLMYAVAIVLYSTEHWAGGTAALILRLLAVPRLSWAS